MRYFFYKIRLDEVLVYHSSSSKSNPITWVSFADLVSNSWQRFPSTEFLRVPSVTFISRNSIYKVHIVLRQLLLGYLLDFMALFTGNPRKWVLIKLIIGLSFNEFLDFLCAKQVRWFNKLHTQIKVFDFFSSHQWLFDDSNTRKLLNQMSKQDREIFNFDVDEVNWSSHVDDYVLGIRRLILKEDDKSINMARERVSR